MVAWNLIKFMEWGVVMAKEYKIEEIYNPDEKNIEQKLEAIFITFLIEKVAKSIE